MKLFQARKRVTRQRIAALVIMAITLVLITGAGLKSIYYLAARDVGPFYALAHGVQLLAYTAYQSTQVIRWLWQYLPLIQIDAINTRGNWGFLFIIVWGGIGRLIWDSAVRLAQRIARIILKVEENAWERELMNQQGQVQIPENPVNVLQINIELLQEDKWQSRPIGIILLAVAVGVLAQWCNLTFGLVKL